LPKFISSTGTKGSPYANKKIKRKGSNKEARANRRHPGLVHRTVRCTTGQCPVHQGRSTSNSSPSGILGADALKFTELSGVHRTVSGAPRGRGSELASLGNSPRLLRYNSPDMSGVHRTVRLNCRATATSDANGYLQRIYCAPARAEVRHAHAGAPDTLQYMSGAPPDI
jgi:hypothetical protein